MGVSCSLPVGPSTVCETHPFSVLQPQFHQGPSSGEGGPVSDTERSIRARSFTFSGLLQLDFCSDEGLGVVETSYRFVNPQSDSLQDSLQDGDPSICASVRVERRLDGIHKLEGCLLANSSTSGQPQVPQICGLESGLLIQGSLFQTLHSSVGFHTVMAPVSAILHRLGISMCRYLDDWLIQASSHSLVLQALDTVVRLCQELGIIINWEISNLLPSQRVVYLGVILDSTLFRTSSSLPRVKKLCLIAEEFLSYDAQPASSWLVLLGVLSSLTPHIPGGRLQMRSLQLRLHHLWDREDDLALIPWDSACRQDLECWLVPGCLQLGISLVVSGGVSVVDQHKGASDFSISNV